MFDLVHPELFRGKVARLKNGNIVQKMLNASVSPPASRAGAYSKRRFMATRAGSGTASQRPQSRPAR